MVVGPPGCGKTHYLAKKVSEAIQTRDPRRILVVSLTKTAAKEAAGRVPLPEDRVGTLHSHAYRALGRPTLAESKTQAWNKAHPEFLLKKSSVDVEEGREDQYPAATRRMEWALGQTGDRCYAEYALARARMQPRSSLRGRVPLFAEKWEAWKEENGYLDFQDLIDHARVETSAPPGGADLIYCDEAQDFSAAEFALLLHWGATAEGVIFCGDWDQALYTWRGADPNTLRTLQVPPERRRVLEQSYRVPRAVHARALRWIERVRNREKVTYLPRDTDGSFRRSGATVGYPEPLVWEAERLVEAGRSVMILAACGYQLDPTIAVLKKRGTPFSNLWRPKNGRWNPLRGAGRVLDFLRPDEGTWGEHAGLWTWEELWSWLELLGTERAGLTRGLKAFASASARAKDSAELRLDPSAVSDLFERPDQHEDLFRAVGLRGGDTDGPAAVAWLRQNVLPSKAALIEYPFRVVQALGGSALRAEPRLTVGTIHSVKGGEADVVFLFPDLSQAGAEAWLGGGEGQDAIHRQFYVGLTRAREEVVLCTPSGVAVEGIG